MIVQQTYAGISGPRSIDSKYFEGWTACVYLSNRYDVSELRQRFSAFGRKKMNNVNMTNCRKYNGLACVCICIVQARLSVNSLLGIKKV